MVTPNKPVHVVYMSYRLGVPAATAGGNQPAGGATPYAYIYTATVAAESITPLSMEHYGGLEASPLLLERPLSVRR